MLQNIRDRSQGWLTWVIVGVISLMFALFGVSYYLSGSGGGGQIVAKVNGEVISNQDFDLAYQRAEKNMPSSSADLKSMVMQSLIEQKLLTEGALKEGFLVSSEQANALILAMPVFQDGGKFSMSRYNQVLQMNGMSTEQLRQMVIRSTLADQVRQGLTSSDFALPSEVNSIYAILMQTRSVNLVEIKTASFMPKVKISDAAISEYYSQHQADFYSPMRVSVQYVELSVADLVKSAQVSNAEALTYYQENQANYKKSYAEVKSQIIANLKQQKAEQQYAVLGAQLATLAYENPGSLDSVSEQLGLKIQTSQAFSQQGGSGIAANKDVLKAAFGDNVLKQDNNSDVINLNDSSAVVLRLAQTYPAAPKPLSAVKADIKQLLQQQAAQKAALTQAQTLLTQLNAGKSLSALSKDQHMTVQSATIARNDSKLDPMLVSSIFAQNLPSAQHPVYGLSASQNGYMVYALTSVTPASAPDASARDAFNHSFMQLWGQLSYTSYLSSLMKTAKVEVFKQ